jgi:osmotically-inducible protein OsmY
MKKALLFVSGIGIGTGLMYLLDPDRGKRRRSLLRDQFVHAAHKANATFGAAKRDLSNRATGLAAQMRSVLVTEDVSDDVLVDRVRAQMGRAVSHPGAIEVQANHGTVKVSGSVPEKESNELLQRIKLVRGVKEVENHLEVLKQPA